jgi:hypothetical protein
MHALQAPNKQMPCEYVCTVPLRPVVQEDESLELEPWGGQGRKVVGAMPMVEKEAGTGLYYRAHVKRVQEDSVLLYFPPDRGPPMMEWVFKTSSRIHREHVPNKFWKYRGDGAWTVVRKHQKRKYPPRPKSCKRDSTRGMSYFAVGEFAAVQLPVGCLLRLGIIDCCCTFAILYHALTVIQVVTTMTTTVRKYRCQCQETSTVWRVGMLLLRVRRHSHYIGRDHELVRRPGYYHTSPLRGLQCQFYPQMSNRIRCACRLHCTRYPPCTVVS